MKFCAVSLLECVSNAQKKVWMPSKLTACHFLGSKHHRFRYYLEDFLQIRLFLVVFYWIVENIGKCTKQKVYITFWNTNFYYLTSGMNNGKVFVYEVTNFISGFCKSAEEWSSLAKKWEFSPSPSSIHRQSIMDNNILDLASLYSDEERKPSWIGMKSTIAQMFIRMGITKNLN